MYDSTRSILPRLDVHLTILPAHGAGTSCGKWLSKQNMDTLGNQQKYNPMLQDMTRDAFIAELTNEQPPIPAYFTHSVILNKQGNSSYPACIHTIKHITSLDSVRDDQIVIDTRSYRQATDYPLYDKAINIPYDNGSFVSMIGWLIKPGQHIILIIERPSDKHIIMHGIASIGYEWLIDGIYCREESIGESHIHSKDIMTDTIWKYTILDIRNESTYRDSPIFPHAINIPLEKITSHIQTLDTIYLPYCGWSYKSDIALSLLHYHGINAQKMIV